MTDQAGRKGTTKAPLPIPNASRAIRFEGSEAEPLTVDGRQIAETVEGKPGQDLYLRHVRVRGDVKLSGLQVGGVEIIDTVLAGKLRLDDTRMRRLWASNFSVRGMIAGGLEVSQRAELRHCTIEGLVNLSGASLGRLAVWWTTIGKGERALDVSVAKVSRSLSLRGSTLRGELKLTGLHVGGEMSLRDLTIRVNPQSWAVKARELKLDRTLWGRGFSSEGGIDMTGADVGGAVDFAEAKIGAGPRQEGLDLYGTRITLSVDLRGACVDGQVRLRGASVGGMLNLEGALLRGHGPARAVEESPDVGSGQPDVALDASHATVRGGVLLSVRGAREERGTGSTEEAADLARSTQVSTDEDSVSESVAETAAPPEFDAPFRTSGSLSFDYASIGGRLDATGMRFGGMQDDMAHGHTSPSAEVLIFSAVGAAITGTLCWRPSEPDQLCVDLTDTHAQRLEDDPASWALGSDPQKVTTRLNGFKYDALEPLGKTPDLDRHLRLKWLMTTETFDPLPYRVLAQTYRSQGRDSDAAEVLRHAEADRRERGGLGQAARNWSRLLDVVAGGGYKLDRAARWLVCIIAATFVLVTLTAGLGGFVGPTRGSEPATRTSWRVLCPKVPGPCFNPLTYSIESVFPVVKFGQTDWKPDGTEMSGKVVQVWLTIAASLGWILGIATVAAVSQTLIRGRI